MQSENLYNLYTLKLGNMFGVNRFLLKSFILTIVSLIVGVCMYSTVLHPYYFTALWAIVPFFFVVTNLVHSFLIKIAVKSSSKFTSQYSAINFLKMFFYLVIAVIFMVTDREHAKIFIANYILIYIVYTIFEVTEFTKVIKQMNQRSNS